MENGAGIFNRINTVRCITIKAIVIFLGAFIVAFLHLFVVLCLMYFYFFTVSVFTFFYFLI